MKLDKIGMNEDEQLVEDCIQLGLKESTHSHFLLTVHLTKSKLCSPLGS